MIVANATRSMGKEKVRTICSCKVKLSLYASIGEIDDSEDDCESFLGDDDDDDDVATSKEWVGDGEVCVMVGDDEKIFCSMGVNSCFCDSSEEEDEIKLDQSPAAVPPPSPWKLNDDFVFRSDDDA